MFPVIIFVLSVSIITSFAMVIHEPISVRTEHVHLKWRYKTRNAVLSSPFIYNDVLYIGSTDCDFYALNASTGDLIWKFHTGKPIWGSSATVWNGIVYFGSLDGNIYALNATDGSKIWTYFTSAGIGSSPTVFQGIVYVGSRNTNLYALNATTGMKKWMYYAEAG